MKGEPTMKKTSAVLIILALLTVVTLVTCGCTGGTEDPPVNPKVEVTAINGSVDIKDSAVADYDYTTLFSVKEDDVAVTVTRSMLDLSQVSSAVQSFIVKCTYKEQQASVTVNVIPTVYEVTLSQQSVTVKQYLALQYDYNQFFTVSVDGVTVDITSDMVTNGVKAEAGEYEYTVSYGGAEKTLKVIVIDEHDVLVAPSYIVLALTPSQLEDYDFTQLFSLYVDGEAVQVTSDMVDSSALNGAQTGNDYQVTFAYTLDGNVYDASVTVEVVAEAEVKVSTRQIVTYPNSEYIDLTTLFTVTKGEEVIPVTNEMISGTIDYSQEGINTITLTYEGKTYVSTVEVKRGVIINYASGDVVTVKLGTDKNFYSFADDFVVLVNGLRFRGIEEFIDVSEVNFNETGDYAVTITVPYNNQPVGLSGANFVYFEKTITYKVVDTEYTMSVIQEEVVLPEGTTEYNFFSNIKLVRNGRNCQVGDNPDWVTSIYCYGEVTSQIDFANQARQLVTIDVYVNGPDSDPVEISYYLTVKGEVTITSQDRVVFGGETVFTTDLFTVVENGQEIEVTYDMVSGKADTFTAGVYYITAQYKGVTATAKVVVMNPGLIGTYTTLQRTIPQTSTEDEEGYEIGTTTPSSRLGKLIITSDGGITLRNKEAQFIGAIDENTALIKWGSYEYTLYYNDGIVVLDPDNSVKLGYNEDKRPMVYFNTDMWTIEKMVVVDSSSLNVLVATYTCHSFDTFRITSADGTVTKWFGLKIALVSKTASDTIYEVSWGDVIYSDGFEGNQGEYASITFDGVTANFEMTDDTTGKIDRSTDDRPWAGQIFTGTVDGKSAEIVYNQYEGVTYSVDRQTVASATFSELGSMKNGGNNYNENTLLLYSFDENDGIYSYKFNLDFQTMTFTLLPQDGLFGKYISDDGTSFLFIDGYGTGVMSFDTSSYATTTFCYTLHNQELKVTFTDTNTTFNYGKYFTFSLADLKNVLTVRYSADGSFTGVVYTNSVITDGAVVEFTTNTVAAGSNCKRDIVNGIRIVTKDGELTYEQKTARVGNKSVVDTTAVDINRAGIYQIKVNITVDGQLVETYYAVQVVTARYNGNPLASNYGNAIANAAYNLRVDEYGMAVLVANGVTYQGFAVIADDDLSFRARMFATDGTSVTLNANVIATGIISVNCSGAVTFNDCFTTGTVSVAGCDGHVLYRITVDGADTYMYAVAQYANVQTVNVTTDEHDSSILFVQIAQNNTIVVKATWGTDAKKGLLLSDSLRGVYTGVSGNLVIDGFGSATVGVVSGEYVAEGKSVTFITSTTVRAFELDTDTMTYTELNVNVAGLIAGKQFSATHSFYGGSMLYYATTTFTFNGDGTVTAVSVCDEYETDEGLYQPSYADKNGVTGTYTVEKNEIIIKINGQTFAFVVRNVVKCKNIICKSTTLSSDDIGYFKIDTVFEAK